MKILVRKFTESVVCTWSDGRQVEITMLGAEGEDVYAIPDITQAMEILALLNYLNHSKELSILL